jgi:nicotinamidase-related amidase
MSITILEKERAVLVIVDVQEAFRRVISDFSPVVGKVCTAIQGGAILGMPIIVTEQYPKGLGHTVEEISLVLPDRTQRFEKSAFGILGDDMTTEHLASLKRKQVVICGLETHVCVSQSCLQLLDAGYEVFLLEDAVASRFESDKATAINRLRSAGVLITTVEAILFEGMRDSKHPNFKEIQGLIK